MLESRKQEQLAGKANNDRHSESHSPSPASPPVQVLASSDLVLLLWALAALQQYGCRLYRHALFRARRLPDGTPGQARHRRMLREATVLHRCGLVLPGVVLARVGRAGVAAVCKREARLATKSKYQHSSTPWH